MDLSESFMLATIKKRAGTLLRRLCMAISTKHWFSILMFMAEFLIRNHTSAAQVNSDGSWAFAADQGTMPPSVGWVLAHGKREEKLNMLGFLYYLNMWCTSM